MRPPSQDIAQIINNNVGELTLQDNLFVQFSPDKPDFLVAVYDSPGSAPDMHNYRYEGVMVRVRCLKYANGWDMGNTIGLLLHAREGDVFNGVKYTGIWWTGNVEPVGLDENNRQLFSINFNIQRR